MLWLRRASEGELSVRSQWNLAPRLLCLCGEWISGVEGWNAIQSCDSLLINKEYGVSQSVLLCRASKVNSSPAQSVIPEHSSSLNISLIPSFCMFPGLPEAFYGRLLPWVERSAPLFPALSLQTGDSVWDLRRAHLGSLHRCSGSQVSPWTFCVCVLPSTTESGSV